MSVYETIGRNQTAVLSALHHRNEVILDLVKPLLATSDSFRSLTAELPVVDWLPTPKQTVEQWLGFWDGVLKEEKEFLLRVIDLLPEPGVNDQEQPSNGVGDKRRAMRTLVASWRKWSRGRGGGPSSMPMRDHCFDRARMTEISLVATREAL
jgi:hypothetical protein